MDNGQVKLLVGFFFAAMARDPPIGITHIGVNAVLLQYWSERHFAFIRNKGSKVFMCVELNWQKIKCNVMKADELVTKEDLQAFRQQLLNDLKALASGNQDRSKEWLRNGEVKKWLKISYNTLQNLRITGKLKATKVGGILFYKSKDIETLLNEGA